ncbi:hypothetical protein [Candidatus Bandiella euplotis]|nr:hypothetical protein [Candidatus Bandiella woodruffii]
MNKIEKIYTGLCVLFCRHRQVKKVEVQKVLREEGKNSKLEQNKK